MTSSLCNERPPAGQPLLQVVAYYRMSKSQQDTSIADQRSKVIPFFSSKYEILEDYVDEGRSGSKDTRKRVEFLRMIDDLTTGKYKGRVKTVVCLNFDRFGRLDTLAAAEHKRRLRDAGVRLDTYADGLLDWSKSVDRIVDAVKSEAAHAVSLTIAEKGLRGRIRATKEGRPNGRTPYGMAKEVTSPTKDIILVLRQQKFRTPRTWTSRFCPGDEQEAAAVRYMFETFASEDITYADLARRLHQKGFPPPGPGSWQGQYLCYLLSNVVFAGGLSIGATQRGTFFVVDANGQEAPKVGTTQKPGTPLVVWDTHEGIVSRELFDAVQQKILRDFKPRDSAKGKPGGRTGSYAFSGGLITCGKCGRPMYGSKGDRGRVLYRCHRGEVDPASRCGYWIAYEEDLLPFVFGHFLPELGRMADEASARQQNTPVTDEAENLRKRLVELDRKITQGRENFLSAPAELSGGLLKVLAGWEGERKELVKTIEAASHASPGESLLTQLTRRLTLNTPSGGSEEIICELQANSLSVGGESVILIPGDGAPPWSALRLPRSAVSVSEFREMLKRIDAKVSVWFKPKAKGKGWDVAKLRAQASIGGVCVEYDSNASYSAHTPTALLFDRVYDGDVLRRHGTVTATERPASSEDAQV